MKAFDDHKLFHALRKQEPDVDVEGLRRKIEEQARSIRARKVFEIEDGEDLVDAMCVLARFLDCLRLEGIITINVLKAKDKATVEATDRDQSSNIKEEIYHLIWNTRTYIGAVRSDNFILKESVKMLTEAIGLMERANGWEITVE